MSDVILYPIRGQLVQVKDKNEYIVYVPRADEYTYGTIKIGKGLISDEGAISVDDTQIVPIKTIAKNGVEIRPDENRQVNIVLTKADVGLNNVNNTADLDKPISIATQAAIDKLSHDLMDDVMNVQESLDDYKLVVDNKFAEQKSDIDGRLLVINNTISQNKTQTDSAIERIEEVLEGKEQAVAFNNYQTVVNAFNMAATNKYPVGQSVYVQSVNVPDLWVYSIENTHIDFAYIGDADIIEKLETNGTVQFGYYKLAMMETKQAVVTGDITTDALLLKLTDSDTVVVSKSGDRVMLSLDATIQNRLSKMLVLPMSNPTTTEIVAVDNTGSQTMIEIGDGLSLENGTLKATGGGATGNFVTTDTEQTITANKNFVLSSQYTNSNVEFSGDYVSISSKRGTNATVDTNTVFVGDYITRLGGINSSDSFSGIEYDAFDRKTKLIGEVEYNGSKVATHSDLENISGGGSSVTVVDTLVSQSTTDALSARQGNVLYNMIVDIDNSIKTAIQDTWEASY